ncbi:hypothetical protein BJV77DRAFT_1165702 [Russula vinacea]|nr:hypothetical protein BJV77DRAFT_1165702 [Russula vinacea]
MFATSQAAAPPLSLRDAHLLNAALTLGYVLPLYFTKYTRLSFSKTPENDGTRSKNAPERWRDDPAVIKARLLSVTLSTIASLCLVGYIIDAGPSKPLGSRWNTTALHLGFSLGSRNLLVYFVTPALFLGPLYGRYLSHDLPFMTRWSFNERKNTLGWVEVRNYIVGPISEELVWRSCLVGAYRLAGASNAFLVFFTPVSFGSAHLHHVWEIYKMHGGTRQALWRATVLALFQFTYTTLFGFHSAFLFLCTSSLLPSISAHIFCNFMGFPQLQAELRWHPIAEDKLCLRIVPA